MIKLKCAYDAMPRSDERRAFVERPHHTEHNNEDAEARDAKASGRGEPIPATASMTLKQPHLRFRTRPVPPFRLDLTVWALRRRARNLVDRWDGTTYRRVVVVN